MSLSGDVDSSDEIPFLNVVCSNLYGKNVRETVSGGQF